MARHVTLVAGPPCSGKTSYVAANAQPGDLVLDQDVLGAKAMRDAIERVAAMTDGVAWVIRCAAGPTRRAHLAATLRADHTVLLNPGDAVLLHRASHQPQPKRHIQAVRKWLADEATDPPVRERQPKTPQPRSRHRTGRPYRRARRQMQALYGDTCWICGHPGAVTADHLDPVSANPDQPVDPTRMRPAHGSGGLHPNPCPTCRRYCNQERGAAPVDEMWRPALTW